MTLRAGRADLHDRLDKAAHEHRLTVPVEVLTLLLQAKAAVLHCPVDGCAFCYAVEQKEATR